VGIDHRRPDILMPEQFLNRPNVIAILQEVGGEGMPKGVARDPF